MGIISKTTITIPSGPSINYYIDKGYNLEYHKPLEIKVEDLPRYSNTKIQVQCDNPNCNHFKEVSYKNYITITKKYNGLYYCSDCAPERREKTCLEKYGVKNPALTPEVIEKHKQYSLQKYGVPYFFQSDYFKNILKEQVRPKIQEKLYNNKTAPTSNPQLYIYNLFKQYFSNCYLNYPIKYYSGDIVIEYENIKYDIEVDFGGHYLSVKFGHITQEEFERKEVIRNNCIEKEGYKCIRIISKQDKCPSDNKLLEMFLYAHDYFSNDIDRTWMTFDIDNNCILNAYHKTVENGLYYDFEKLRTIKKINIEDNRKDGDINVAS